MCISMISYGHFIAQCRYLSTHKVLNQSHPSHRLVRRYHCHFHSKCTFPDFTCPQKNTRKKRSSEGKGVAIKLNENLNEKSWIFIVTFKFYIIWAFPFTLSKIADTSDPLSNIKNPRWLPLIKCDTRPGDVKSSF